MVEINVLLAILFMALSAFLFYVAMKKRKASKWTLSLYLAVIAAWWIAPLLTQPISRSVVYFQFTPLIVTAVLIAICIRVFTPQKDREETKSSTLAAADEMKVEIRKTDLTNPKKPLLKRS